MDSALVDASIVALLVPTPDSIDKLSPADVQPFMGGPVTVSQMPDGNVVVTSMKGQLELHVRKSRVEAKDWSGKEDVAESRAPVAMAEALKLAHGKIKALGVNYEMEAKVDVQAGEYMAQLLAYGRLSNIGRLQGKSVSFQLLSDGQEYNIVVQPRWGKLDGRDIFISINMPVEVTEMPAEEMSLERLQEAFKTGWARAKDMADRLLAR